MTPDAGVFKVSFPLCPETFYDCEQQKHAERRLPELCEEAAEMRRQHAWGLLVGCMALSGCVEGISTSGIGFGASGQGLYETHCVMCHGPSGRGDGDFAGQLLILPPDLTGLSRANDGDFPREEVALAIEGEGRKPHFSGAMPEFAEMGGSGATAKRQIDALVRYLESIQD